MGTTVDTFGSRLRQALTAQNLGVRTLAKRMTAQDPARMESVRRQLNKYVNEGVTPTDGARHEIEDALQVDRDSLLVAGADDEEPSLETDLLKLVARLQAERADLRSEFEALRAEMAAA